MQSEIVEASLDLFRDLRDAVSEAKFFQVYGNMFSLHLADDQFLPLASIELKRDLMAEHADYLPDLPQDLRRRVRGEQDIIVRYAREQAIATLPQLLADPDDRARLLEFMELLRADPRLIGHAISDYDVAVMAAIRQALGAAARVSPAKVKEEKPAAGKRASAKRTPAGRQPRT